MASRAILAHVGCGPTSRLTADMINMYIHKKLKLLLAAAGTRRKLKNRLCAIKYVHRATPNISRYISATLHCRCSIDSPSV